jgi:hypothetical protein
MHSFETAWIVPLRRAPAAGYQVKDQNDQRHDQQNVNESTGKVQTETQKPKNEKDHENCPQHIGPPSAS